MPQKTAASLLFILLAGCDALQSSPPAPAPAEIKWVVADKYTLTQAVTAALTRADPAIELGKKQYKEMSNERQFLNKQIEHLELDLRLQCYEAWDKVHKQGPAKSGQPPSKPPTRLDYSPSNPIDYDDPDYRACLRKITTDPLLNDLQSKQHTYYFEQEREYSQREQTLRQNTESTLTQLLDTYAQAHGYQLIIESGERNVLFNRNKIVLNVTADLLDFIGKQPLITPAPPVANKPATGGNPSPP
ncbi:OmpH family outer membrane protein [Methylovulum psychrotolerans]|uniref:Uncharacterized protein n=1 Tax=Methylovulum psychrotolerans TaxID=1704499 RepID=A0A1Z4BTY1_9GAMM|nr:OmpH family outer membrane protein [Methylovulum psychrotolerans]ASF44692.1 hypothetical protein CEK71_00660 [Methylovulum psychrotolerans]